MIRRYSYTIYDALGDSVEDALDIEIESHSDEDALADVGQELRSTCTRRHGYAAGEKITALVLADHGAVIGEVHHEVV